MCAGVRINGCFVVLNSFANAARVCGYECLFLLHLFLSVCVFIIIFFGYMSLNNLQNYSTNFLVEFCYVVEYLLTETLF